MNSIRYWVQAARPKTLFAAAAPVMIGTAIAYSSGVLHGRIALLVLTSALLIQIGTNFFNDYADFKGGVDTDARKGPERAVHSGKIDASAMRTAAVLVFVLAVVAGISLMLRGGWPIVAVGFFSILFGFLYTAGKYSLAGLGIADLFVFLFFGPVAVAGTYYVQALSWPAMLWTVGVAPGAMSVAILLVNNTRDIEEDRAAGRKTLVVRLGRAFGVKAYIFCIVLAALVPIAVVLIFDAPVITIAASVALVGTVPGIHTLRTTPVEESEALNTVLVTTARSLFFFSVLYATAWILAA